MGGSAQRTRRDFDEDYDDSDSDTDMNEDSVAPQSHTAAHGPSATGVHAQIHPQAGPSSHPAPTSQLARLHPPYGRLPYHDANVLGQYTEHASNASHSPHTGQQNGLHHGYTQHQHQQQAHTLRQVIHSQQHQHAQPQQYPSYATSSQQYHYATAPIQQMNRSAGSTPYQSSSAEHNLFLTPGTGSGYAMHLDSQRYRPIMPQPHQQPVLQPAQGTNQPGGVQLNNGTLHGTSPPEAQPRDPGQQQMLTNGHQATRRPIVHQENAPLQHHQPGVHQEPRQQHSMPYGQGAQSPPQQQITAVRPGARPIPPAAARSLARNEARYTCPKCETTLSRQHDLERHVRTVHSVNPQLSYCPWPNCDRAHKAFTRHDKYLQHLHSKHHGREPPMK